MSNHHDNHEPDQIDINPATGLPMTHDTFIDVGGSPYGFDNYQQTWIPQPNTESGQTGFDPW